jgi:16S rRNA (cytidine1402-2'-O)-methyltransferase
MLTVFPADHQIVIAREITKLHETIVKDSLANLLFRVQNEENMRKGEFVVIVDGMTVAKESQGISEEEMRILSLLLKQCSIKTAVALAVEITGQRKKLLYQAALDLQQQS